MLQDQKDSRTNDELIVELQTKLAEAEQTLSAIQNGEIDAIITLQGTDGPKVYTLESADTIYRNLIEEMSEGVATLTHDGTIFYCNVQLASLLQVPLDKTIGLKFNDFVIQDDLEKYDKIFNNGIKTKDKGEINIKSVDGKVTPALISINNIKDLKGVYIVVSDLTEQMHHEELKNAYEKLNKSMVELRSTETLLSAVTNLSSEIIYIKDRESNWVYVNPALEHVLGKTAQELLGKSDLDIYSDPEIGKAILENDKHIMESGEEETLEEIIETPNGKRPFISVKTPRFNEDGQVIGIVGISHDITDRKKAEETLKRQAALLDASYEAIFSWEYDGKILSWNKGAERLYGYSEEEALGQISHKLLQTKFQVEFEEFYEKLGKEKIWNGEITHTTKYGKKIVVETRQQMIQDPTGKNLVIEVNRDITKRIKMEKELKRSEQSLAEAQHIAHIGSWEWNIQTGEIDWSDELYSIYNVNPETFNPTMSSFNNYMHPEDEDYVNKEVELLLSEGTSHNFDFRIILDDGSIRVLNTLAEVAKFDEDGKPLLIVGINQDITERKKTESKLNENLKKLAESNKELEQFAYITSHDLKEPLRMITSFLQLLERKYKDELDQDANEYIGFAVDGAKRLDAMTNDLLLYSKISRTKDVAPVNFENALELAQINLKVPIEESDVNITHDPLPTISGDESLLVRLFQNLIGNAIKYQSNERPEIHISAKKEKNQYLFSVEDNGIGMSHDHLEQIFTIFKRLHTHNEYEGTGIGLAIAQKIVYQHGGEIWVESELGKGSTFYFTIHTDNGIENQFQNKSDMDSN